MSAMLISRKGVKRPTFGRMTDDPTDPAQGSVKPRCRPRRPVRWFLAMPRSIEGLHAVRTPPSICPGDDSSASGEKGGGGGCVRRSEGGPSVGSTDSWEGVATDHCRNGGLLSYICL